MNLTCFFVHNCNNPPVVYVRDPRGTSGSMVWPICEEHKPLLEEGKWTAVSAEEYTMRTLIHDINVAQPSGEIEL